MIEDVVREKIWIEKKKEEKRNEMKYVDSVDEFIELKNAIEYYNGYIDALNWTKRKMLKYKKVVKNVDEFREIAAQIFGVAGGDRVEEKKDRWIWERNVGSYAGINSDEANVLNKISNRWQITVCRGDDYIQKLMFVVWKVK